MKAIIGQRRCAKNRSGRGRSPYRTRALTRAEVNFSSTTKASFPAHHFRVILRILLTLLTGPMKEEKLTKVRKFKPRPKDTLRAKTPDDHSPGLWIDHELLRRQYKRDPHVLLDNSNPTGNRFIELADIALGLRPSTSKKKQK